MPVEIRYENEKLIIPEVECSCGMRHNRPDMDIYIGSGIVDKCAQYIRNRNFGSNALIVVDNIIYELAGRKVESLMEKAGFNVSTCLLEREEELEPDEAAIGEILFAMEKDIDFLVAVGSGSVNDLTRYVSFHTGRPFVSIGTAASMDGYLSVVAPLLNKGLKVNKPATYPKVLICDLDIMKKAPYPMFISGFGDVLGKYIAKADWIMGKIVNGEEYCPACVEIISQAVEKCVDNIDGIRSRTAEGTKSLIEALILAGLTILIIGNTRPVASNEHNMGHYWEMLKLLRKEKAASHGTAVGVATGYCIRFFEYFLQAQVPGVNKEDIRSRRPSRQAWEDAVREKYTSKIGSSILRDNPEEYLDWSEQERRIDILVSHMDLIRKELAFLPSWEEVLDMYKRLGAPITAEEIGIDRELLENALLYAKDYRNRYTVFKSANELGMLEELVGKVMRDYRGK